MNETNAMDQISSLLNAPKQKPNFADAVRLAEERRRVLIAAFEDEEGYELIGQELLLPVCDLMDYEGAPQRFLASPDDDPPQFSDDRPHRWRVRCTIPLAAPTSEALSICQDDMRNSLLNEINSRFIGACKKAATVGSELDLKTAKRILSHPDLLIPVEDPIGERGLLLAGYIGLTNKGETMVQTISEERQRPAIWNPTDAFTFPDPDEAGTFWLNEGKVTADVAERKFTVEFEFELHVKRVSRVPLSSLEDV